jgi:hypothetical protein
LKNWPKNGYAERGNVGVLSATLTRWTAEVAEHKDTNAVAQASCKTRCTSGRQLGYKQTAEICHCTKFAKMHVTAARFITSKSFWKEKLGDCCYEYEEANEAPLHF